ncbi:MAG TPA: SRPBCC family protein [Gemmatimonadales bacterium]|nr:SRPBCC family protein [Gemmatimonadales bacterium]
MSNTGTLTVTTPSDREIAMSRSFNAPRPLVFEAWTKPELLKRWLTGPPQWSLVVAEVDLRVGGRYRYVWRNANTGMDMGMGGVYREITVPERIVATEKFDEAWYSGEAVGTLVFIEYGGRTTVTQTLRYESREARDSVLKSGMESGVAMSYNQLEALLAETAPA